MTNEKLYEVLGDINEKYVSDTVVKFPDDGHPTLCAEAVNILGDARDEIVTWDYNYMYIYTQDDEQREDVYKPYKYPDYNASNYRGEYSYREIFW